MTFGKGISLRQFSPTLRQDAKRHQIILQTVEIDSVIEGLPRFTKTTKKECLEEIRKVASKQ